MRIKHLAYVSGGGKGLFGLTIGDALRESAKKWPKSDALVSCHEKVTYSYKELLERSEQIAEGLVGLGLPKQARIGILAPNCKEWTVTQLAASLADLVLVNINPAYQTTELEYALKKVGVSALVMTPGFKSSNYIESINQIAPEVFEAKTSQRLPELKHLILIGKEKHKGTMKFDDLYGISCHEYLHRGLEVSFEDPTNIQFTSGTTGTPKAATLTHHNILNNGYYIGQTLKYSHNDRVCIPVPLYHCFGMVLGNLACITHGAAMVYPDYSFSPVSTMDSVEKEKCTALYGVPTMFIGCLRENDKRRRQVMSLRTGIVAGSVCTPELMKRIIDDLHISEMTNAYGMTETSPVSFQSHLKDNFDKKISTVGQIHPHCEAKIINKEGRIVDKGEPGELCTRGYIVMKGYWDDPQATKKVIDQEGWMHTGDLASMDEEGYVRIIGRNKDMIIRGGENIYPAEVENFYMGHPDIEDIQVIGVPDKDFGEQVCAWVKMKPGKAPLTLEGLEFFGKGKIAHYKIPKLIKVVDEFPMTVTGKIKKFLMRAEYMDNNN